MFTMGTLSCAVCGTIFSPLRTSSENTTYCRSCGTSYAHRAEPLANGAVGNRFPQREQAHIAKREGGGGMSLSSAPGFSLEGTIFSPGSLKAAEKAVQERLNSLTSVTGKTAGVTEVDNRVLEETFCGTCGKHTLCRSFARQTRSADEGQTIFFQCTVCKSEWQHNS